MESLGLYVVGWEWNPSEVCNIFCLGFTILKLHLLQNGTANFQQKKTMHSCDLKLLKQWTWFEFSAILFIFTNVYVFCVNSQWFCGKLIFFSWNTLSLQTIRFVHCWTVTMQKNKSSKGLNKKPSVWFVKSFFSHH